MARPCSSTRPPGTAAAFRITLSTLSVKDRTLKPFGDVVSINTVTGADLTTPTHIQVVLNWLEELRTRVPVK